MAGNGFHYHPGSKLKGNIQNVSTGRQAVTEPHGADECRCFGTTGEHGRPRISNVACRLLNVLEQVIGPYGRFPSLELRHSAHTLKSRIRNCRIGDETMQTDAEHASGMHALLLVLQKYEVTVQRSNGAQCRPVDNQRKMSPAYPVFWFPRRSQMWTVRAIGEVMFQDGDW